MYDADDDFDGFGTHDHDGPGAFTLGAGYALYRHGQDRQTEELIDTMSTLSNLAPATDVHVHLNDDEFAGPAEPINALDFSTADEIRRDPYVREVYLGRTAS